MRNLKFYAQLLAVRSVLTLSILSSATLGWAQSGSPAPPSSEPRVEQKTVEAVPPSSEADVASETTSANGTATAPTEPDGGTVSSEKEFNPSEEIVEDQAVSFPVDI